MRPFWLGLLPASMLVLTLLISMPSAVGEEERITYRLTIQIHEAPGYNQYHLFYICNFQIPGGNSTFRKIGLTLAQGDRSARGISAYSLDNSSLSMDQEQDSDVTSILVTTNGSEFEVRYYVPLQARVLKSDDQQLIFTAPRIDNPLRGMTVAINWPNWKYQIHEITPEGAEMVMNPMFETDPYKSVSYYWYFSGSQANEAGIDEISVVLRSAATVSRVNRNQTIIILLAVVCIPTAIFIAFNPPKKAKVKERQRKFRITDERDIRAKKRRERYRSK